MCAHENAPLCYLMCLVLPMDGARGTSPNTGTCNTCTTASLLQIRSSRYSINIASAMPRTSATISRVSNNVGRLADGPGTNAAVEAALITLADAKGWALCEFEEPLRTS